MGSSLVRAVAEVLHLVIYVYTLIIIVRSLMSWVGNMPNNAFTYYLRRLTDPLFYWVHRHLPFTIIGGIDISPIIILLALQIIDNLLYTALMNWAFRLALAN